MEYKKIEKAVLKAERMAEDRQEGSIVLQLHPKNRRIIISWQLGNSWESMGLNAIESENRILHSFDCRDYEPVYYEDEPKTESNRLDLQEQEPDEFFDICEEIERRINEIIN